MTDPLEAAALAIAQAFYADPSLTEFRQLSTLQQRKYLNHAKAAAPVLTAPLRAKLAEVEAEKTFLEEAVKAAATDADYYRLRLEPVIAVLESVFPSANRDSTGEDDGLNPKRYVYLSEDGETQFEADTEGEAVAEIERWAANFESRLAAVEAERDKLRQVQERFVRIACVAARAAFPVSATDSSDDDFERRLRAALGGAE